MFAGIWDIPDCLEKWQLNGKCCDGTLYDRSSRGSYTFWRIRRQFLALRSFMSVEKYRLTGVVISAPSAAPQSVEAVAVNSSSIRVTWQPPPTQQHNGVIIGYRVRYASEWATQQDRSSDPPRDAATVMMTASDRSCVISGLATWNVYRIWVSAFTRAGEGPNSDVIVVQTDEGGTFLCGNWNLSAYPLVWSVLLVFFK